MGHGQAGAARAAGMAAFQPAAPGIKITAYGQALIIIYIIFASGFAINYAIALPAIIIPRRPANINLFTLQVNIIP